jgi:hypothetical protein
MTGARPGDHRWGMSSWMAISVPNENSRRFGDVAVMMPPTPFTVFQWFTPEFSQKVPPPTWQNPSELFYRLLAKYRQSAV